jgi:hypothetical protein
MATLKGKNKSVLALSLTAWGAGVTVSKTTPDAKQSLLAGDES